MDVEKFVLENIDAMACELRPVEYISNLIAAAIAQDREERAFPRCAICLKAAPEYCEYCLKHKVRLLDPLAAKLERPVRELVKKLHETHDHPAYKAVWDLFNAHGHCYKGPCYEKELKAVDAALEEVEGKTLMQVFKEEEDKNA